MQTEMQLDTKFTMPPQHGITFTMGCGAQADAYFAPGHRRLECRECGCSFTVRPNPDRKYLGTMRGVHHFTEANITQVTKACGKEAK